MMFSSVTEVHVYLCCKAGYHGLSEVVYMIHVVANKLLLYRGSTALVA